MPKEPTKEQVKKCTRCGVARTDSTDSDICGNCADDLRAEYDAIGMSAQAEAEDEARAECEAEEALEEMPHELEFGGGGY